MATTLATVWARVEPGFTWKTGKESLPSIKPRVDKITEMKLVQGLCKSGSDEDRVRSYYGETSLLFLYVLTESMCLHTLTSVVEMFPTTLK